MRHGARGAIVLLFLLALAGAASAMTITAQQPFASTRSGDVSWKAGVTMTLSSMSVYANELRIDGLDYDVEPASGEVLVNFTQWASDLKKLQITRSPAAGFTLRVDNQGVDVLAYNGVTALTTCAATTPVCTWIIASNTSNTISLYPDFTGELVESPPIPVPTPLPPAADTGVVGGGGGAVETLPAPLPPIPNPVKLIPRLDALQWASVGAGLALMLSGFPRTSRFLPPFLRIPGMALPKILVGAVIVVFVYLSTPGP